MLISANDSGAEPSQSESATAATTDDDTPLCRVSLHRDTCTWISSIFDELWPVGKFMGSAFNALASSLAARAPRRYMKLWFATTAGVYTFSVHLTYHTVKAKYANAKCGNCAVAWLLQFVHVKIARQVRARVGRAHIQFIAFVSSAQSHRAR